MNMTHRDSFLLQSSLSVLTLISVSTPPRVTAAARKRLRSFWQKCKWQVTSKDVYTSLYQTVGLTIFTLFFFFFF